MPSPYVINETLTTLDGSEGRIDMGIGNCVLHTQGKEAATKKDVKNGDHDNLEFESILCSEKLLRNVHGSESKAGDTDKELVKERSGNEHTIMYEKNDECGKSCEPDGMGVRQAVISSTVIGYGSQQINFIDPKDQNISDCSKDDRSVDTVCKDESYVTSDNRQLFLKEKRFETSCEFPNKNCGIHPNECSKNSYLEENCDLNKNYKRSTNSNNSVSLLEKLLNMVTGVPVNKENISDECSIGASTKNQQCEHNKAGMLQENNCNTNESVQREKEKHKNDSQMNCLSVDASSNIVESENFHENLQQCDDTSIMKEIPQIIENISEDQDRISKTSARDMGDKNISDSRAKLNKSVLNETLYVIQGTSKEIEGEKDKNYAILPVSDSKMQQDIASVTSNKNTDECLIGTSAEGQQCKHNEASRLRETNCNTNESKQKEKEKHKNDSPINFSSDAVDSEGFHENLQQQFDENSIMKEVPQIVESISEDQDYRTSKPSTRKMRNRNISDSRTKLSKSVLNETRDIIQIATEEIGGKQNKNNMIPDMKDNNLVENLPKRHSFMQGSFPRIILRMGGYETVRRIKRVIKKEREKRECVLTGFQSKGTSTKRSSLVKKQKAANRKSGNHYSENICKTIKDPDSINDPKLKRLLVRIERIDERLLSKYKVNLQSYDRRTGDNKISDKDLSPTIYEVSNLKKNKVHLEDSTNYQMLKDSGIDIRDNETAKLPTKKVNKKVTVGSREEKTQFQSHSAKLIKPVSVKILKMDDTILSKYGYGSQEVKTSNALIPKSKNLPIAKAIRDDCNVRKEMTDEQLRLNPAQICLTKIDYVYPSILKQTLKLNESSRNSNVNKTTKVSASNLSDSRNKPIHLKTGHVSIAKVDNVALSKHDSSVNVAKKNADIPPIHIQSQKLTSKKPTALRHCEFDYHTLNASRTSQKRKVDSYNEVIIDDFSKENVCLNGESWHLKRAKVSLTKLDNSALPKFSSPCPL